MKYVRNALIGLYVNLFLIVFFWICLFSGLLKDDLGWKQIILIIFMVISGAFNIMFAIINFVNTYKLYKRNEFDYLRKYMKAIKLGAIPYFILNFIFFVLLFLLFAAATRGIMLVTPMPLLFLLPIFFTYLSVIFTSSYGIGYTAILYKEQKLKSGKLVIHILLQLCFVMDVLDTIVLLRKYKVNMVSQ